MRCSNWLWGEAIGSGEILRGVFGELGTEGKEFSLVPKIIC